jgi:hypothetical protein
LLLAIEILTRNNLEKDHQHLITVGQWASTHVAHGGPISLARFLSPLREMRFGSGGTRAYAPALQFMSSTRPRSSNQSRCMECHFSALKLVASWLPIGAVRPVFCVRRVSMAARKGRRNSTWADYWHTNSRAVMIGDSDPNESCASRVLAAPRSSSIGRHCNEKIFCLCCCRLGNRRRRRC